MLDYNEDDDDDDDDDDGERTIIDMYTIIPCFRIQVILLSNCIDIYVNVIFWLERKETKKKKKKK